jgi:hypothetical protein
MSYVEESFTVPNNREYQVVLLDSYGDGHNPLAVTPELSQVFRISDQLGNTIFSVDEFTRYSSDGYRFSSVFTLGVLPTDAPTISPAPSTTMAPTSSPTELLPFISVVITFDYFPENIGFRLEMLSNNMKNNKQYNHDYELLHAVYPGSFSSDLAGSNVVVKVPLRASGPEPQTYMFTMTSNEGHGLEDGGGYEVWLGDFLSGELLFKGGDKFYYEQTTSFEIEPYLSLPTKEPNNPQDPFDRSSGCSIYDFSDTIYRAGTCWLLCFAFFGLLL